jgi:hypothetical protein
MFSHLHIINPALHIHVGERYMREGLQKVHDELAETYRIGVELAGTSFDGAIMESVPEVTSSHRSEIAGGGR